MWQPSLLCSSLIVYIVMSVICLQAMESSSKNSREMLDKLTLTYNRGRQAKITTELNEIISGAISLEDAK